MDRPQIIPVTDQILQVVIPDALELARTFGRAQEAYESPRFHRAVFTFDEMAGYYQERGFDYVDRINGYNIPAAALAPFREGIYDPLSDGERYLLDSFGAGQYIIASKQCDGTSMRHEIAHGLWATSRGYRTTVLNVLDLLTELQVRAIGEHLLNYQGRGYHPAVHRDETHAYLLTMPHALARAENPDWSADLRWLTSFAVLTLEESCEYQQKLTRIFDRHYARHRID